MARFRPGQSGNPSGRPKGFKEIEEAARALCPEAIEFLAAAMRSEAEPMSAPDAE